MKPYTCLQPVLPALRIKVYTPSNDWDPFILGHFRRCSSDAEVYTLITLLELTE